MNFTESLRSINMGGRGEPRDDESRQDVTPILHYSRSTLGFADGHAEMHIWIDKSTKEFSDRLFAGESYILMPGYSAAPYNNNDILYMRRNSFIKITYRP